MSKSCIIKKNGSMERMYITKDNVKQVLTLYTNEIKRFLQLEQIDEKIILDFSYFFSKIKFNIRIGVISHEDIGLTEEELIHLSKDMYSKAAFFLLEKFYSKNNFFPNSEGRGLKRRALQYIFRAGKKLSDFDTSKEKLKITNEEIDTWINSYKIKLLKEIHPSELYIIQLYIDSFESIKQKE